MLQLVCQHLTHFFFEEERISGLILKTYYDQNQANLSFHIKNFKIGENEAFLIRPQYSKAGSE